MDTATGNAYLNAPTVFDGYILESAEALTESIEGAEDAAGVPSEAFSVFPKGFSMNEYMKKSSISQRCRRSFKSLRFHSY